jgi:PAS domain S-box-containing protein
MRSEELDHPIRILLVEDDPESGMALSLMLGKRGVGCAVVSTGTQGLDEFRSGAYDVVVTDIRLPGLNGVDLLRAIRSESAEFPVILLTGFDSLDSAIQSIRLGAQDYILKPLGAIEDLLLPVQNAVRTHRVLLRNKALEGELRRGAERYALATRAAKVGLFDLDVKTGEFYVDPLVKGFLGYEDHEVANRGEAWRALIHPDDLPSATDALKKLLKGEARQMELECRMLHRDGRPRWIAVTATLAGEAAAPSARVVGTIGEITAQKTAGIELRLLSGELERRVRERTAELEAANRELEAFSYSVSHDLRAPLRAISGFSHIILEEGGLSEAAAENLERIRAAARKMSGLIDDLLGLSRITRREMQRRRVDLSGLARHVVEDLRKEAPERHVDVAVADGLEAEGDPELIENVLRNLLENAWKFTSKTEHACIEFGMRRAEREMGGGDSASRLPQSALAQRVFFVRDNGAGFDMAYADKLFGPFQRLHSEAEFPGSGIGLATVQRIIRRHGGYVWAEGEVGKGATVFFTI